MNLIYDHQTVFSLHDEDLGLCDRLKHIIPTTTDKPIYLPHQTISVQLQMEVQQYLDTWLQQGIISPSHSPYASQVVIVQKKLGEIHLCIDSRALNAITVCDSFPLPHIEEALQAVKAAVWFTSCKRMGLVHTLVMSIKPICRYSSTWCRRGKSWSRHQNCKRMGLVHTLVMSIKPICRYSSTWCRRGKSWSRHQNCKRIGWVHKVISQNLC